MNITKHDIDGGKPFDWGKTSTDYGKYRDIYPPEFYRMFTDKGYCVKGQHVLDLGTGTGVLPRISIRLVRNGQERIFHRSRLQRQNAFLQKRV